MLDQACCGDQLQPISADLISSISSGTKYLLIKQFQSLAVPKPKNEPVVIDGSKFISFDHDFNPENHPIKLAGEQIKLL